MRKKVLVGVLGVAAVVLLAGGLIVSGVVGGGGKEKDAELFASVYEADVNNSRLVFGYECGEDKGLDVATMDTDKVLEDSKKKSFSGWSNADGVVGDGDIRSRWEIRSDYISNVESGVLELQLYLSGLGKEGRLLHYVEQDGKVYVDVGGLKATLEGSGDRKLMEIGASIPSKVTGYLEYQMGEIGLYIGGVRYTSPRQVGALLEHISKGLLKEIKVSKSKEQEDGAVQIEWDSSTGVRVLKDRMDNALRYREDCYKRLVERGLFSDAVYGVVKDSRVEVGSKYGRAMSWWLEGLQDVKGVGYVQKGSEKIENNCMWSYKVGDMRYKYSVKMERYATLDPYDVAGDLVGVGDGSEVYSSMELNKVLSEIVRYLDISNLGLLGGNVLSESEQMQDSIKQVIDGYLGEEPTKEKIGIVRDTVKEMLKERVQ